MKSNVQMTIYFPDDIERIISGIEIAYIESKNGREDPTDGFISFTTIFRTFFSKDLKHHYLTEHIKAYAETTKKILGEKCNKNAFEALARAFEFYIRYSG